MAGFQGYQGQFTQSPLQINDVGMLTLNPISTYESNKIALEWVFLNPGTLYPFSQVIYYPPSPGSGTLTITMPDATYASYPQSILVINQTVQTFIQFADYNGTLIQPIVNPAGSPSGSNIYLFVLTNNTETVGQTAWISFPISGTLPPQPAAAVAGLGLITDTYFPGVTPSSPLFVPSPLSIQPPQTPVVLVNPSPPFSPQKVNISISAVSNITVSTGNPIIFNIIGVNNGTVVQEQLSFTAVPPTNKPTVKNYTQITSISVQYAAPTNPSNPATVTASGSITTPSTQLFNPNSQTITLPSSTIPLTLSPYAINFPSQAVTINLTYSGTFNQSSLNLIVSGIDINGIITPQTFPLSTGSSQTTSITTMQYISILSVQLAPFSGISGSLPASITATSNLNNISITPLDTTQPVITLTVSTSTYEIQYENRNSILLAPSGNDTYTAQLPDLTSASIGTTLANGFVLGFVNQSSTPFTISVPSTIPLTTINQTQSSLSISTGTSLYLIYNAADLDWLILGQPLSLPLSVSQGGTGQSFDETDLTPNYVLAVSEANEFTLTNNLLPATLVASGNIGSTAGIIYTGPIPPSDAQVGDIASNLDIIVKSNRTLFTDNIQAQSTASITVASPLTALNVVGNINSSNGIIYTGPSVPGGAAPLDIASSGNIRLATGKTLYTDNIAIQSAASITVASPLTALNVVGNINSSNGIIYTGSAPPTGVVAGDIGIKIGNSLHTDNIYPSTSGSNINIYTAVSTNTIYTNTLLSQSGTGGIISVNSSLNISNANIPKTGQYAYLNSAADVSQASTATNYPLYVNGSIGCGGEFHTYSSKKIKTTLSSENVATQESIEYLKKIRFHKYKKKDQFSGIGNYYGVFAEELNEILPQFVSHTKDFVPNIYQMATVSKLDKDYESYSHQLTFEKPFDHSILEVFNEKGILLEDAKVKIYDKENKSIEVLLTGVLDDHLLVKTKEDTEELPDLVFVYGIYESCPSVNKDGVAEMGLLVVKNHEYRIEYLENTIKSLLNRIEALEAK